ncbi:MAG TPA: hypothetical protein VHH91_01645 [Vicinamibacterales bacterium]|nr:hypothetical protein [Vicinamibacterales bacterium]
MLSAAGVTLEHPFFDAAHGELRPAGDLSARSRLLVWLGSGDPMEKPLASLGVIESRTEVDVFNLSVAGDEQNYFAEGILVHNKSQENPTTTSSTSGSGGSGGAGGAGGSGGSVGSSGTSGTSGTGGTGGASGSSSSSGSSGSSSSSGT